MLKQDVKKYSTASKFLHWLIAAIVAVMLFSFFLEDLPKANQPTAYMIHKSLGLTILFLMIFRVLWIIHSGRPSLPETVPLWQKNIARLVQYSLYIFLFAMPISGWIMSVAANKAPVYFGLFTISLPIEPNMQLAKWMNQAHEIIAWILIGLLALHLAGALKHSLIDKDNVLGSMLPFRK